MEYQSVLVVSEAVFLDVVSFIVVVSVGSRMELMCKVKVPK
jgi:hypothetical protein